MSGCVVKNLHAVRCHVGRVLSVARRLARERGPTAPCKASWRRIKSCHVEFACSDISRNRQKRSLGRERGGFATCLGLDRWSPEQWMSSPRQIATSLSDRSPKELTYVSINHQASGRKAARGRTTSSWNRRSVVRVMGRARHAINLHKGNNRLFFSPKSRNGSGSASLRGSRRLTASFASRALLRSSHARLSNMTVMAHRDRDLDNPLEARCSGGGKAAGIGAQHGQAVEDDGHALFMYGVRTQFQRKVTKMRNAYGESIADEDEEAAQRTSMELTVSSSGGDGIDALKEEDALPDASRRDGDQDWIVQEALLQKHDMERWVEKAQLEDTRMDLLVQTVILRHRIQVVQNELGACLLDSYPTTPYPVQAADAFSREAAAQQFQLWPSPPAISVPSLAVVRDDEDEDVISPRNMTIDTEIELVQPNEPDIPVQGRQKGIGRRIFSSIVSVFKLSLAVSRAATNGIKDLSSRLLK